MSEKVEWPGKIINAKDASPMSAREEVLRAGIEMTGGDRNQAYGDPKINLGLAGELKRLCRRHAVRKMGPGEEEAMDQVITKIARVFTGKELRRDNYIDGATYFAIAYECAEAQDRGVVEVGKEDKDFSGKEVK